MEAIYVAFQSGDPAKAWEATQRLVEVARHLSGEAASLRFKVNFGTDCCQNCDGLRAGPGVLATCFQLRQCNYTNVKEGEASPRQLRVLQTLLTDPIKKT